MNKYLIKIDSAFHRDEFILRFEKVGQPQALPDYLVIETKASLEEVILTPGVLLAELDEQAEMLEAVSQPIPPGWGLPWISDSGGSYDNDASGENVDIYVIDTGIRDTHEDLAGRVRTIYSFDGAPYALTGGQSPTHGTSVAACAAGTKYGTAKHATIVNCRIDFMTSTIMKALDSILKDHLDKPDDRPSIINFSGSSMSSIIGDIFERLSQYGVVLVAAAGNSSEAQPRYPARNIWVVAVGAINAQEQPAWFTNKQCDVYAPGQNITTASVFSDTSTTVISGTSFSSPYYAGLLACLLEGSDKFNTPRLVSSFVWEMRNQMMETGRIENFPNGNLPVRTATANGLGGSYYVSPSKMYTDEEIANYLQEHADDVQLVADGCREGNLSFNRLARMAAAAGYTQDEVSDYFEDAGVKPWWSV